MAQAKDRERIIKVQWDEPTATLTFNVKGCEPLPMPLNRVSEAVKARAMRHGLVQRVSDAAALDRNNTTGASATPEEKRAAMARLVDHYLTGTDEWSPARAEGGTIGLDPVGIAAMCEVMNKDELTVRAFIERKATGYGFTQRAYLAKICVESPSVKVVFERMKAEAMAKIGPDVDIDADLNEMG